jgi:hypothetical protein
VQAQSGQRSKAHALATPLPSSSNARMALLHVRCEVVSYGFEILNGMGLQLQSFG